MTANRLLVLLTGVALVVAIAALGLAGATVFGDRGPGTPASSVLPAVGLPPHYLTVQGKGTADVTPDKATVMLGVFTTKSTVREANSVVADEMTRLLAAVRAQGVEDADIKTSSLGIQQITSYPGNVITGYQASASVIVTIHRIAIAGGVVSAAADAVGNDFRLNSLQLSVSDPAAALRSARARAAKDAGDRARQWADLTHVRLGAVTAMSETTSGYPYPCTGVCAAPATAGGASKDVPVEAGTSQVTVSVTAVYRIG